MSASMAEGIAAILAEHKTWWEPTMGRSGCSCGHEYNYLVGAEGENAHRAEQLAAYGYGKLGPTQFVLREREAELLKLKGPCSFKECRLHYAHHGPCDTRRPE